MNSFTEKHQTVPAAEPPTAKIVNNRFTFAEGLNPPLDTASYLKLDELRVSNPEMYASVNPDTIMMANPKAVVALKPEGIQFIGQRGDSTIASTLDVDLLSKVDQLINKRTDGDYEPGSGVISFNKTRKVFDNVQLPPYLKEEGIGFPDTNNVLTKKVLDDTIAITNLYEHFDDFETDKKGYRQIVYFPENKRICYLEKEGGGGGDGGGGDLPSYIESDRLNFGDNCVVDKSFVSKSSSTNDRFSEFREKVISSGDKAVVVDANGKLGYTSSSSGAVPAFIKQDGIQFGTEARNPGTAVTQLFDDILMVGTYSSNTSVYKDKLRFREGIKQADFTMPMCNELKVLKEKRDYTSQTHLLPEQKVIVWDTNRREYGYVSSAIPDSIEFDGGDGSTTSGMDDTRLYFSRYGVSTVLDYLLLKKLNSVYAGVPSDETFNTKDKFYVNVFDEKNKKDIQLDLATTIKSTMQKALVVKMGLPGEKYGDFLIDAHNRDIVLEITPCSDEYTFFVKSDAKPAYSLSYSPSRTSDLNTRVYLLEPELHGVDKYYSDTEYVEGSKVWVYRLKMVGGADGVKWGGQVVLSYVDTN